MKRESVVNDHGEANLRVHYPKYKYGEATVKEEKIPQKFGKFTLKKKISFKKILAGSTTIISDIH